MGVSLHHMAREIAAGGPFPAQPCRPGAPTRRDYSPGTDALSAWPVSHAWPWVRLCSMLLEPGPEGRLQCQKPLSRRQVRPARVSAAALELSACRRGSRMPGEKWRRPRQPHPGTRVGNYRCSLPGLAGFTTYHCEGTAWITTTSPLTGAHRARIVRESHCHRKH